MGDIIIANPVIGPAVADVPHDPYAAFRFDSYRHFLSARVFFTVGSQMQNAAVGWQIYERFGSKMALGWIGLVQSIPIFLLALPSGHLADRFERRKIIITAQSVFFACSIALAASSAVCAPPVFIYALLLFLASCRAFIGPSMGALLPTVIPRGVFQNATTWNSSVFELTQIMGPAAAGAIIAASGGATAVFCMAAGCTLVSMFFFTRLHSVQEFSSHGSATIREVVAGVRFVLKTKMLLAATSLDLFATLLGGATSLLPVVAKDILHTGPMGFGLLRAAPSMGAMVMALATAHLPPWKRAGHMLFGSFFGFGAAIVIFGFSTTFWLSMAMLILTGVCDNLNVVIRQTLLQFITPDQMRGRVGAVNFVFVSSSNELGAFESGTAAHFFGTVWAISGGGIGAILVAIAVMMVAPQLRKMRQMRDITPAPI